MRFPGAEKEVTNTAFHPDSLSFSGIFLNKFPMKKGGKVNKNRYRADALQGTLINSKQYL